MSHEQTKAAQYIRQLDDVRCDGNWGAIPELVRKIRKHAPDRACLALTAEAEYAVTQAVLARAAAARPKTAASKHSSPIAKYIPHLLDVIEKERRYMEDEFQAQVCLGWVHWYLDEPALAAGRLPKDVEQEFAQLDGTNKESVGWTKVCAIKASYIKGNAQAKTGAHSEALTTFESTLPVFASISATQTYGKELKKWSELYLTDFCMLASQEMRRKATPVVETETLTAFRAWGKFWAHPAAPVGGSAPGADASRLDVWKEYYIVVSDLLQQNLPFPVSALTTAYPSTSTRYHQREELKIVESRYEALLLKEVQFPKAEETNEKVEEFVGHVMQNWRILCGSTWKEGDLGDGGAEAVSRGVLEVLYRAASKTFHSTPLLRNLFTLHLAVAEFDLAFKAFDTYLEIVKKGKARVEKTGEQESGLDEDEEVLATASEGIKALCKYGSQDGADKAKDLAIYFEGWLEKHHPVEQYNGNGRALENDYSSQSIGIIAPKILAMAWRSIGIAHAQWARFTYEAASRTEIQLHAIKCFRTALHPSFNSSNNIETLFSLGIILAERRELNAAIDVVKVGLVAHKSPFTNGSSELGPRPGRFSNERLQIPLWHLMALLFSARQDFLTAAKFCEGAFEQFQDPKNLFGDSSLTSPYRSDHLKASEKNHPRTFGVVDEMDDFEKENVLEVKMTQLAIIEVLEGPEIAVNASDELLSLYRRLFGDPSKDAAAVVPPSTATISPPKSSAGTIRSIKGSIFGRSGRSQRKANTAPIIGQRSNIAIRPQTSQTVASGRAPTIQVIGANGSTSKQRHHLTKETHPEKSKRSTSLSARRSSASRRNRSSSASRAEEHTVAIMDGDQFFTPPIYSQHNDQWLSDSQPTGTDNLLKDKPVGQSKTSKPLPPKPQSMQHTEKFLKPATSEPSSNQDTRLPHISPGSSSTTPRTRFPELQRRRRKISILIRVWLLVGGFYRRAAMHEDAQFAVEEASKLALQLESDVLNDSTGNFSISSSGWGSGKSVGELLGDVFFERGYLALAESDPYRALSHFETSISHFADHPSAIVGLSNILLDIYNQDLSPPPPIIPLIIPSNISTPSASTLNTPATMTPFASQPVPHISSSSDISKIPHGPLGISLPGTIKQPSPADSTPTTLSSLSRTASNESSTALLYRLAARDRAYGLLNMLTKLGTGWNYSEAWFALARAYELGGQVDKAKEVLWWCVELEEGRAIRDWREVVGSKGYVL